MLILVRSFMKRRRWKSSNPFSRKTGWNTTWILNWRTKPRSYMPTSKIGKIRLHFLLWHLQAPKLCGCSLCGKLCLYHSRNAPPIYIFSRLWASRISLSVDSYRLTTFPGDIKKQQSGRVKRFCIRYVLCVVSEHPYKHGSSVDSYGAVLRKYVVVSLPVRRKYLCGV